MKKIFTIILSLTVLLAGGGITLAEEAVTPPVEAVSPSVQDEALLELINEARANPLDVAESLGLDRDKILEDFPELEEILTEGLPPLSFNGQLLETAREHTGDMFSRGYYSSVDPDGVTYEERLAESGYPVAVSGESLGMILFANFINSEDAVQFIFEYMFQDELDPNRTEKRNILDPCLKEAGISVKSGKLVLGGSYWNVYLATCDFGSVITCLEDIFLQLVNEARKNPLQMAAALDMDTDKILADFPAWQDVLTEGLPPLAFNTTLASAARAHAADMLENGYYSHDSLDGRTYVDRIIEVGYEQPEVGESIGFWRLCNCEAYEAVKELFQYMFKAELAEGFDPAQWKILDPTFNEVGIGVATGESPDLGSLCGDFVELLVADYGVAAEEEPENKTDEDVSVN